MKKYKFLCLILTVLSVLSMFTFASSGLETEGNLSIRYLPGKCNFDFYRVADYSADKGLVLTSVFDEYKDTVYGLDELTVLDASSLRLLASTLEALVRQNSIVPDIEASTDEKGELSLNSIPLGTYLVVGEKITDGTFNYIPSPIFVSVPSGNTATSPEYNVTVEHIKYEKEPSTDTISLKVMKIWNDSGNREKRPSSVSVQLLKNSVVYETVLLSKENNWIHEWKELSAESDWKIAETDVPDGYKMSVSVNNSLYVIENVFEEDKAETTTEPDNETTKDKKETTEPTTKDVEKTTKVTTTDGDSGDGEDEIIIETGQLWRPVPFLLLSGLAFMAFGVVKRKED